MGWRKEAPYDYDDDLLDDFMTTGCLPWPLFTLVLALTLLVRWI